MKFETGSLPGGIVLMVVGISVVLASPQPLGANAGKRPAVNVESTASRETGNTKMIHTATFAMG